jgi:hypothetical protein
MRIWKSIAFIAFLFSARAFATQPDAIRLRFDNSTNGFTSVNVQAAIEESRATAQSARFVVSFGWDGTASTGRWLEMFKSVPSNNTPFVLANNAIVKGVSFACESITTAKIGLYKNAIQIDTLAMVAAKTAYDGALSISAIAGDQLSAKVESGSCSRVIYSVFLQSN